MGFTVYDLKPRFQALLRPIVRFLARAGVTANQITIVAAFASVALGVAFELSFTHSKWQHCRQAILIVYPFFLFARMALNAFDGMLAREFNQQSALGAFLNELGDVVSDVVLYLPFLRVEGVCAWSLGIAIFLGALGEFSGVVAQTLGGPRRYDGPLGKSDRALLFGLFAIVLAINFNHTWQLDWLAEAFSWLVLVLAIRTVWNRVRLGIVHASERSN